MPKRSLYPTGRSARFSGTEGRREIDLRAEFDNILFGGPNCLPHGKQILIRRMNLDDSGNPIPCTCRDRLTDEPDNINDCPFCMGEGYYWDEQWETAYETYVGSDGGLGSRRVSLWPGFIRTDQKVFYLRYDVSITYNDKIVEVLLDSEGEVVVPYKRKAIYRPETIDERRSDRGRVEFKIVHAKEFPSIREEP